MKRLPSTNFGQEVVSLLSARSMTQTALAGLVGRGQNRVNHVIHGTYHKPTASWVELIANALDLPDEDRYRLHLAAARDQGFKL